MWETSVLRLKDKSPRSSNTCLQQWRIKDYIHRQEVRRKRTSALVRLSQQSHGQPTSSGIYWLPWQQSTTEYSPGHSGKTQTSVAVPPATLSEPAPAAAGEGWLIPFPWRGSSL